MYTAGLVQAADQPLEFTAMGDGLPTTGSHIQSRHRSTADRSEQTNVHYVRVWTGHIPGTESSS